MNSRAPLGTDLFENSPEPLLSITDLQTEYRVAATNSAFDRCFEGTPFQERITIGEPLPAESLERTYLADLTPAQSRLRRQTVNGWRRFEITKIPQEDGMILRYDDVTDAICREQQIAVFARVFRHDLRNQLNIMLGCAQSLEGDQSIEPLEGAIDYLLETAEYLGQTATLLDHSHPVEVTTLLERLTSRHPAVEVETVPSTTRIVDHRVELALDALLDTIRTAGSVIAFESEAVDAGTLSVTIQGSSELLGRQDRIALRGEGEQPKSDPPSAAVWLSYWLLTCTGAYVDTAHKNLIRIHLPLLESR